MTEEETRVRVYDFVDCANDVIATRLKEGLYVACTTGTELHVDEGGRFYLIRGNDKNNCFPKGYVQLRVEKSSGNMYRPSGKKVVGSVHSSHEEWQDLIKMCL